MWSNNFSSNNISCFAICAVLLAAIVLGCGGMKRPWRDYTERPFSSADWLAGDRVERGRMVHDMYCNEFIKCKADVSTRDQAVKTLGEPDIKKTIEGKEVWFYRVDIGVVGGMDLVPVSFDDKGRGLVGYSHGGTRSMMEKEEDLK
jgi:hypothetical protein